MSFSTKKFVFPYQIYGKKFGFLSFLTKIWFALMQLSNKEVGDLAVTNDNLGKIQCKACSEDKKFQEITMAARVH